MIGYKSRVGRRVKSKLARNIETLYREGKCRECTVVVTRMDFAKILGKYTKVKIQYETSSPKVSKPSKQNSNVKLKNNENGLVSLNKTPNTSTKELKKKNTQPNEVKKHTSNTSKSINVLKENNNCKSNVLKKVNYNKKPAATQHKQYGIIFVNPIVNGVNDVHSKITLAELIPHINKSLLPNEDWCIEFFPKNLEPKDDKMYNRIAAELEDLMYNKINTPTDNKMDDFPSIMDILNDNTTVDNQVKDETHKNKPHMVNDVEAMLLGNGETKPHENKDDITKETNVMPMTPSNEIEESILKDNVENPHSPSILDEALKEGKEQHIPRKPSYEDKDVKPIEVAVKQENSDDPEKTETKSHIIKYEDITEVIFKKILDGICVKSVTCLKNLRYNIQIEEKSVEFIGAPKYITSIEDIQVLLEIADDTTLNSPYVLQ